MPSPRNQNSLLCFQTATQRALRALGIPAKSRPEPGALIDLRQVARGDWPHHLGCPLQLPPEVARYVAGLLHDGEGATMLEKDHLEERIITYHHVTAPYTVIYRAGKARLARMPGSAVDTLT